MGAFSGVPPVDLTSLHRCGFHRIVSTLFLAGNTYADNSKSVDKAMVWSTLYHRCTLTSPLASIHSPGFNGMKELGSWDDPYKSRPPSSQCHAFG